RRKTTRKVSTKARPSGAGLVTKYVYMVMFNQIAISQLLSYWQVYKKRKTMPTGLGAWSAVFRCLRDIRRWGPDDRLRETGLLSDALEPTLPQRLIPVEIELWPRHLEGKRQA